jgi:hypothetical protein
MYADTYIFFLISQLRFGDKIFVIIPATSSCSKNIFLKVQ